MKKNLTYLAAVALAFSFAACGGQKKQEAAPAPAETAEAPAVPAYKIVEKEQAERVKLEDTDDGIIEEYYHLDVDFQLKKK